MKKITVKLFGTVTHGATREFVLQYSPEVDPQLISPAMLEELADQAQVPWVHMENNIILLTEHSLVDGEEKDLPTITLSDTTKDSTSINPES